VASVDSRVVPEPWQTLLILLAGFVTGVLSGMFGIGGAVVSNPAIRAMGASPIESVGTTLPSILPSALSGALRYRREGLLRERVILWVGLTGAVATVGGSLLTTVVPDPHLLTITIAILIAYTAVRTGLGARAVDSTSETEVPVEQSVAPPERDEWWLLAGIGLIAGLFSGLLGIGGGLLLVPAFITILRLPLKVTLGSSLACVGIIAVPGVVTHTILGHIVWSIAIPLSIAVIPGARIGANLAIGAADRKLRIALAIVLGVVAVLYAISEIVNLLD